MDVSDVDGAADTHLVGEALELIWGILDDLVDDSAIDRAQWDPSLDRLKTLASLLA